MPGRPFKDVTDPDDKRKEIVWIAISFIVILAAWLAVVLVFGYQPLMLGVSYDEAVLLAGLGMLIFCMVLYLGAREREQRYLNRRLLAQLRDAVRRLDERLEQLKGLYATSAELAGSLDIEHISRSVVDSLTDTVRASGSSLLLVDSETGRPVYEHHSPSGASDVQGAALDPETPMRSGRAPFIADLTAQIEVWNELRSMICAPLRLGNGWMGVLGARRREGEAHFTPDDLRLLTTLANMAAKAIESAHLHAELRESYFVTVRALVSSLHARDDYTAAHSQRTVNLAVRIAERMELPEGLVRDLEVFGPLHDVGKIGIRDDILLKTSALSEEERELCQEHCIIGERIIRPLKPSEHALSMVRSHHELWDGKGYPDGLSGEETPILARVLGVADCYDAMSTDRPYQPAMSEQEVLAHFRQHAGKRYDPRVVEALCAAVGQGERREAAGAPAGSPVERPTSKATARAAN
ncbi:MAG: HD domain-containing protein [Armatimonadota bacterium]|nr:MAG: HD domain-containing protein [Armatimonadota bacterium]